MSYFTRRLEHISQEGAPDCFLLSAVMMQCQHMQTCCIALASQSRQKAEWLNLIVGRDAAFVAAGVHQHYTLVAYYVTVIYTKQHTKMRMAYCIEHNRCSGLLDSHA